jgi:hypothetical protein
MPSYFSRVSLSVSGLNPVHVYGSLCATYKRRGSGRLSRRIGYRECGYSASYGAPLNINRHKLELIVETGCHRLSSKDESMLEAVSRIHIRSHFNKGSSISARIAIELVVGHNGTSIILCWV